ncbi:MAG: hypothetical protein JNK76_21035 [Planctomycetales bacterium]|nr:hypothetical protein [Planctomycetales bacterium]MBN8624565.1 hypothetical protein [Planctomycetota bacterium]
MKRLTILALAASLATAAQFATVERTEAQQFNRQRPPGQGQNPGMNRQGGQGGQRGPGGKGDDDENKIKLPDDPKLLMIHKNFVEAAEKLAADYERQNLPDKARDCYTEILRLVPTYSPAADKLNAIKTKEATAEKKLVDVMGSKGWQDTGVTVVAGKPLTIRANGEWVMKMTYTLSPDGIEIPKELRDFPLGSLVGAISESADLSEAKVFLVGKEKSMEPNVSGRLYLRMYDSNPDDNTGRLGVIVEGTFKK